MLPITPAGHCGAPRSPGRMGAGATPSFSMARRAQPRTAVNSRRRFATARVSSACSSGYSIVPSAPSSPKPSTATTDSGSSSSITGSDLHRQNAAQRTGRSRAGAPLTGVAHGHLFEADTLVPGGPWDVQMTVDHGLDAESAVPAGGQRGAAPHRELGVAQDVHRV